MSVSQIVCYPALLNTPRVAPGNLQLNSEFITSYVQRAAGGANISLTICRDHLHDFPRHISDNGVSPDDLKGALATLLKTVQKVNTISVGLFLTDSFAHAFGQYGVMFDTKTGDVPFGPRLGCAVSLASINQAMPNDAGDNALPNFIAYIALHELGHVFNLWHATDDSVMQPNPNPDVLGTCDFNKSHKQYLARINDSGASPDIIPGQSDFGVRPSDCPQGADDVPYAGSSKVHPGLKLHVGFSHDCFWPFEPIELDLSLSVTGSKKPIVSIRDEIDPAYTSFQIWLTNPRGERRLFRSDFRFCRPNGTFTVKQREPFRRDISMLIELGRHTFNVPGNYEAQVVMFSSRGKKIESNTTRCVVKRPRHGNKGWDLHRRVLANPAVERLLRYKQTLPSLVQIGALDNLRNSATPETASLIQYAIGKACFRSAMRTAQMEKVVSDKLKSRAMRHLEKALKKGSLGHHRKKIAEALMLKLV
jgi:hypothetical protein